MLSCFPPLSPDNTAADRRLQREGRLGAPPQAPPMAAPKTVALLDAPAVEATGGAGVDPFADGGDGGGRVTTGLPVTLMLDAPAACTGAAAGR